MVRDAGATGPTGRAPSARIEGQGFAALSAFGYTLGSGRPRSGNTPCLDEIRKGL